MPLSLRERLRSTVLGKALNCTPPSGQHGMGLSELVRQKLGEGVAATNPISDAIAVGLRLEGDDLVEGLLSQVFRHVAAPAGAGVGLHAAGSGSVDKPPERQDSDFFAG